MSFAQYLNAHLQPAGVPAFHVASQPAVARQNSATTSTALVTPAQIAARLVAANQPPTQQALQTVDAPVYGNAYMKELNYNGFANQTNQQNQNTYAEYHLNVSNWALNESQRQALGLPPEAPPQSPQYLAVNGAGFEQWWSNLSSNFGNASPIDFITPVSSSAQSVS